MLVEYGFETKDEDMVPKAIELRRRMASRRLEAAVKAGAVGEEGLKKMLAANKAQVEEHAHENFAVSMAGVNGKITVARAEQQLNLEAKVKMLHRDIDRVSKLSKSRIDVLGDLEGRIQRMRNQLRDPTQKSVDEEIGAMLRKNGTESLESSFEVCQYCQRRILAKLFEAHTVQCRRKEGHGGTGVHRSHENKPPVFSLEQNEDTALTTFQSGAPRNCRAVDVGSTSIQWGWEEPVTDGGLPIYEYELRYTEKFMELNKKTKRYTVTVTEKESHLTSCFAALEPVCHHGTKVVGLRGGTEYNSWRIRCRTLRGWSEWADMLVAEQGARKKDLFIMTAAIEPPSQPLFFRLVEITSSCLHLAWDAPFTDGGSDLADYCIFFTVNEIRTTTTERDVVYEVDTKHYTEGIATSAVLRNLPADTLINKIFIKAINKRGLISEAMKLPKRFDEETKEEIEVKTLPASRYALTHREFERCANSAETFIDTSFFTGVQQRLLRVDFMKALEEAMKTLKPDELERQEAKEWAAVLGGKETKAKALALEAARADPLSDENAFKDELGDMLVEKDAFVFTNQQRRQHFKRKLENLVKDIESLSVEKYNIDAERSRLTNLMKKEQTAKMSYKLERDRVKNFTGQIVTSSVLSGAPMQYVFGDFLKKLAEAGEMCEGSISESKFLVMAGETRKAKLKTLLVIAEEELKNRKALFLQFDIQHKKHMKALYKLSNADADEKSKKKYFQLLHAFAQERIGVRALLSKLFLHRLFWQKRNAFIKWARPHELEDGLDGSLDNMAAEGGQYFISQGGLMLDSARSARVELQAQLRTAIAGTTNLKHKFSLSTMASDNRHQMTTSREFRGMEEGMDHVRYEENGMHYLYEADGYTMEGNFVLAYGTYESQIIYLRSKPKLDIKLLAIVHGRLGKMFLLQSKFDRAIVEFGRQLSLASEIDDKPEQADSYFGMGTGYLEIRDYDNAVRYLSIAQTRLASLGNMPKYCGCMRALREVYERLGQLEPAKMYDEKIFRVEGELRYKLNTIGTKLSDLGKRLNNTNAEIEHMVHMERTSLRAIKLKNEIHELHEELDNILDLEDKQEEVVDGHKSLLKLIQKETDEAFATDELEMITQVINPDVPTVMEVEELKNRLNAKKKSELALLEVAGAEYASLSSKVRNLEDTIHDKDANLDLENGALMKNSRHDMAFRCIAFCSANAAGDEVTGTSTGGSEVFVAAEGNNIHVLDYHSGELVTVFAGEAKGTHREGMSSESLGHGGVVTALFHDCTHIYSGSTDETIRKWNVTTHAQEIIFRGHEGSITAIGVDARWMCSGSSDTTMRLWDKHTGQQVRTIYGHNKSVLSIDLGPTWMLSGSADEEVRVWSITEKSKHTTTVDCKNRLIGHEAAITCVKYSKLEIISADVHGRIFIWWMKTGEVIRKINAHESAIKCIQFDAVHIVSAGIDHCVDVIDIATGEIIQKLRGHEGSVIAVAFDSTRIVTAGGDNTLRYWQWGKKTLPQDKFHVLNSGESLVTVSKMFPGTSVDELMTWNGIKEARQIYNGMKLIVKKGDPGALTEAEKTAAERERRRLAQAGGIQQRIKETSTLTSAIKKYDRVHRIATDMDYHSLGNRMFKQAKADRELFPDKIDLNANPLALSQRMLNDTSVKIDAPTPKGRYFMNKDNEEEWGPIADKVASAMMELLVEFVSYDMVVENKRQLRSTESVIGRIHAYEAHIETAGTREQAKLAAYRKEKRFLMPEERKAKRHAEKKARKELEKAEKKARKEAEEHAEHGEDEDSLESRSLESQMTTKSTALKNGLPLIKKQKQPATADLEIDGIRAVPASGHTPRLFEQLPSL